MDWKEKDFSRYSDHYRYVDQIYEKTLGCISWHFTTGNNLEVIELEAAIPGLGQGYLLYRKMVERLVQENRMPAHSVIGYRRSDNKQAEYFYRKMGWHQIDLGHSLYKRGGTTLLWTTWQQLRNRVHV